MIIGLPHDRKYTNLGNIFMLFAANEFLSAEKSADFWSCPTLTSLPALSRYHECYSAHCMKVV